MIMNKIRGVIGKEYKQLEWYLEELHVGCITLMCKDSSGQSWPVATITSEGILKRCHGVDDNIGLDVNPDGYIHVEDE
jgi:hypothetical protein